MFGFLGGEARAQLNSPVADVALSAVLNQSLTVTLDATAVNFTMTDGSSLNGGEATISVTTDWVLNPSVGSVAISGLNKNSSQVNTLDLNITLTGLTLSAGTYTGTMHIQAQAL